MPNYDIKEARERTELEKQLNAQIEKRLAKLKEIQKFNNDTASSLGEQYTTHQKLAQAAQAEFDAKKNAYDLISLSAGEQEAKAAALEKQLENNKQLSEAEMENLELLRQASIERAKGPEQYAAMARGIREAAADSKKLNDSAKEQQQLVDVVANDIGVKFANSLGLVKKKQDGIIKSFIKTKDKAKFLKNAIKGVASQISLVNIGSKLMKSGFQMMVGMLAKTFGSGGGGGGKNLSEFVKMTGHAQGQMYGLAKETAQLAKKLKVGFEEGGKAVGDLMHNMSGFMDMSKRQQKTLATGAVKMMAFGVSAETSANLYEKFTTSMQMTAKEAVTQQRQMFFEAQKMGVNIAEYQEGFLKFTEAVPGFGKKAAKAYKEAASAAKALGFRTAEALAKATEGFDNYEDSATKAAQMNQVFGKQVFDSTKLMNASLDGGPGALAKEMNAQLADAGMNFKDMSRAQKLAMAEASGKSVDELEKLMQGKAGQDKMAKASKKINSVTNSVKKFNQAIKKTKPPGGGGGGKSFIDMILKSYNKLTGGKFFKKIRLGKKGLKEAIQAVADYIAQFIKDMEDKFQEGAKEFINKYKETINSFGKMVGIDDLAGSLTEGLDAVKDMFPLLLPAVPMLLGGATALLGVFTKVVGLVPTLVKGVVSMGKGLVDVGRRGKEMYNAFKGTGDLSTKISGAWAAMTGDSSKRKIEDMAAEAKPVVVTNMPSQAVPVAGDGTGEGEDGELGAAPGFIKKGIEYAKGFMKGGFKETFRRLKGGYKMGKVGAIGKTAAKFGVETGMDMASVRSGSRFGRMSNRIRGVGGALKHTFGQQGRAAIGLAARTGGASNVRALMSGASEARAATKGAGGMLKGLFGGGGGAAQAAGKAGGLMSGFGKAIPVLGTVVGGFGAFNKVMEGDFTGALGDVGKMALAMTGPIGATAVLAYEAYDALRTKTLPGMVGYNEALGRLSEKELARVAAQEQMTEKTKKMTEAMNKEIGKIKEFNSAAAAAVEKFYGKTKNTEVQGKGTAGYMNALADAVDGGEVDDDKMMEAQLEMKKDLKANTAKFAALEKTEFGKSMRANKEQMAIAKMRHKAGMEAHASVMKGAEQALKQKLSEQGASESERADALRRFEEHKTALTNMRSAELRLEIFNKARNEAMQKFINGSASISEEAINVNEQFSANEALYYQYLKERQAAGEQLTDAQTKALNKLQGKQDLTDIGFSAKTSAEAGSAAYMDLVREGYEKEAEYRAQQNAGLTKYLKNKKGIDVTTREGLSQLSAIKGDGNTDFGSLPKAMRQKVLTLHSQLREDAHKAHKEYFDGQGQLKKEFVKQFRTDRTMKEIKEVLGDGNEHKGKAFEAIMNTLGKGDSEATQKIMTEAKKQLEAMAKDGKEVTREVLMAKLKEVAKGIVGPADEVLKKQADIKKKLEAQSYKVSQKDITNLATYKYVLESFAKSLTDTDIGPKMAEFLVTMDTLVEKFAGDKAQKASSFMENMGIMFYNSRALSSSTGRNVAKLGVAMTGMIEDVDSEKFKAVAAALASVGAVHVAPESKSAIDMLKVANEEFPKLKKAVEEMQTTTAGQLFFKGGDINQNIDTTTTVKLVVGAREFGNAALHGLKETGHATVKAGGS